ncbi:nuclease-related domain-containing protein [Stutzerimonas chloritidismutans]|uniref:nuclease-related domain-containing protein n=1 Tax=Stutzerimonas chloritidismutans TaxID=203192 RepID=UPI001D184FA0|nr:nuclease-related domain-containing protein [Stutzerimonas chloritidismutans]UEG61605.1 NERD domain-containing protein [Stutzerimonas chloritidismutans]
MARFFPVRSQCQFDTPGERRFAERLEKLLEDDYLCWSNVPVGPKARYPDFVVLHPRRGILVLEVKDWKLATIQSATHGKVTLYTSSGLKTVANPMLQARSYVVDVGMVLKKDLLQQEQENKPVSFYCLFVRCFMHQLRLIIVVTFVNKWMKHD